MPLAPYKADVLAVFTDQEKAVSLVPILLKAGLNPTSVEFMDNGFVRSASDYSKIRLAHYEDGSYVILTLETFDEDELEKKLEKLDELCRENGADDVMIADDRVWTVRKNCLESVRVLSKVMTSDDLWCPWTRLPRPSTNCPR